MVGCSRTDVPRYVHNLLAKSIKFIPQPRCDGFASLTGQKHEILRKFSWLMKCPWKHCRAERLSKMSNSAGHSAQLDGVAESQLQHFGRMLHAGLAKVWNAPDRVHKPLCNITALDKLAMTWLQRNADTIRAVESDKNLGIVLTSVPWIYSELRKQLRCFTPVTMQQALEIRARAKQHLQQLVDSAFDSNAITCSQRRFLLADIESTKFANLRINVKVHKSPVESRPLSNMRGTFIGPFSLFLNAALLDFQDDFKSVVSSSREVVARFENLQLDAHEHFMTFDIKAIYPSLDYDSRGKPELGNFLVQIFKALLKDPLVLVELDNQIECFRQTSGLPTGLSCSGTITNIFLACKFDPFVVELLGLREYSRYIDDGLSIASKRYSKADVSRTLNSWHSMIVVPDKDIDLAENVHFLDLRLQVDASRKVYFETFRKDLGIYDYIPPCICTCPGCFQRHCHG